MSTTPEQLATALGTDFIKLRMARRVARRFIADCAEEIRRAVSTEGSVRIAGLAAGFILGCGETYAMDRVYREEFMRLVTEWIEKEGLL